MKKFSSSYAGCFILFLLAISLSACGFKPRGETKFSFETVYISADTALTRELKRYLQASHVTVVKDARSAQASLEILQENQDKSILSLNSQGRVREYSLSYQVRFRLIDQAGKELLQTTTVEQHRELSFDESQVLAKEGEEQLLYQTMQSDLVQQLLRRLSVVHN